MKCVKCGEEILDLDICCFCGAAQNENEKDNNFTANIKISSSCETNKPKPPEKRQAPKPPMPPTGLKKYSNDSKCETSATTLSVTSSDTNNKTKFDEQTDLFDQVDEPPFNSQRKDSGPIRKDIASPISEAKVESTNTKNYCPSCGEIIGEADFCPYCGSSTSETSELKKNSNSKRQLESSHKLSNYKQNRLKTAFMASGITLITLVAIAAGITIYAFNTAYKWEVIDVPQSTRTVNTGTFRVTMDSTSPCYVGQDWTDCTNAMIDQYNSACVGHNLSTSTTLYERLTTGESAASLCSKYENAINEMKAQDEPGYYVVELGDFGNLTANEITRNEIVPAITHEATCYLGFIGECPE